MQSVLRLNLFLKPYRRQAFLVLVLLVALVALDLAIP